MAETIFGRGSMRYADALSASSLIERGKKNTGRAIEIELQILAIYKSELIDPSAPMTKTYFNLAELYADAGNTQEGDRYYDLATETAPKVWPPSDLNVTLFRTIGAGYFVGRGNIPKAHALVRLALVDMETYPQLKEFDTHPPAEAIARLGEYHENPSFANRVQVAKSLRFILDNAAGRTTIKATEKLKSSIAKLGIEPAAAEP